jgi:hypothetical protein
LLVLLALAPALAIQGYNTARRPDEAAWIGKPIPPERVAMLEAQADDVRVAAGLGGRQRDIATARPGGPLAGVRVVVGRDRVTAFADIEAATRRGLVLIVLGAVLALATALVAGRLFIRRPVDRLLRTAAAWQAGDLAARTGLRGTAEFDLLGLELDAMAGALQAQQRRAAGGDRAWAYPAGAAGYDAARADHQRGQVRGPLGAGRTRPGRGVARAGRRGRAAPAAHLAGGRHAAGSGADPRRVRDAADGRRHAARARRHRGSRLRDRRPAVPPGRSAGAWSGTMLVPTR